MFTQENTEMDRRLVPANDRVVAADWSGASLAAFDHLTRVTPQAFRIAVPVVDLCRTPNGPRDRQLIYGETVDLLETRSNVSFVRAHKDGYVGFIAAQAIAECRPVTHWICAPATHIYPDADFKSREIDLLSLGARVQVIGDSGRFVETPNGFIPRAHLREIGDWADDPLTIAKGFLGTPYLWGANTRSGIDCSGLVQTAMTACNIPCAADSDLQEKSLGLEMAVDTPPQRGDILFWKGHVGLVSDDNMLLHANAWAMATALEPLASAIERIQSQGDGPVTSHRRLS
jgi:cell wall-associated NlpC family hydrolase